ncbi:retrotransposon hot spot (RHS) protein, putative [Trypanosoma cruzi marinkellei]|uniref:Retrotransposon hot spot (RHS) protein, putative n=1 Tax=Trypanosoma cruzi marinkellei TaxID=85056 RepID=K2MNS0_TRYCR|nr:retrotransposon hot spot (RHS) protein, putative [Trypanosoma cruzi marinkellei]
MSSRDILNLLVRPAIFSLCNALEISGTAAFMDRGTVNIIKNKLKELKPPGERASCLAALQRNPQGHPDDARGLLTKEDDPVKHFAECGLMYKTATPNFPLVDAIFFFVKSPRKTMVGLQMTTAGQHHTTASTVRQFTEYLSWFFKNWGEFSLDLSWEIIYLQPIDSKPINKWQRCDVVNSGSREEKELRRY